MLTRRSLSLSHPQALPSGPVLRREILQDSLLAEQLLEAARAEAQALLEDARQQAARLREEARASAQAEAWRQADTMLADWQVQRQQMWEQITHHAQTLVGQAWQQLTGEQDDPVRIEALIRQLATTQPQDEPGVLHCHPDWVGAATDCLQLVQAAWSVRADPQLAADTLCLRTEQGEFSLGWGSLVQALWPEPATTQA
ncbi:type III secretion system stator protein SctL [Pseudomonas vanderleydeniana]|uniref:Type III secretion system stator protein SctL n=1 Tax=Pseudomonas vanderleydeniana TaxID=2745495 RepID=A0A9E6PRB9_9PSED|nr:type III secretion system stator protein SctL [Pseudomonas vanderleydeniana]QXI31249.1 type III secretion system stator protein SctL [Pseudomonas vanderleydeniana]